MSGKRHVYIPVECFQRIMNKKNSFEVELIRAQFVSSFSSLPVYRLMITNHEPTHCMCVMVPSLSAIGSFR